MVSLLYFHLKSQILVFQSTNVKDCPKYSSSDSHSSENPLLTSSLLVTDASHLLTPWIAQPITTFYKVSLDDVMLLLGFMVSSDHQDKNTCVASFQLILLKSLPRITYITFTLCLAKITVMPHIPIRIITYTLVAEFHSGYT